MGEGGGKRGVSVMAYEGLGIPWDILHSNNPQARKMISLDPRDSIRTLRDRALVHQPRIGS